MTAFGPEHGLDEPARSAALLRAAPPADALAWVSRMMDGAVVEECEVLRGGSSSAMHVLTLRDGGAETRRVVLRRYVLPPGVYDDNTDSAAHEATALDLVAPIDVPTPTLLAVDPTGEEAGIPALLMSELDGRPVWEPGRRRQQWCDTLAETLVAIHGVPVEPATALPAYAPYRQKSYAPPRWVRDAANWERAVELCHEAPIDGPACFVHRDFHPGNVLWRKGWMTGVVDWQNASIGPAAVDVGHQRLNLFFYDVALAEQFTTSWEQISGTDYDPWADLAAIIGGLDSLRAGPSSRARLALDNAVADAVASIDA